MSDPRGTIPPTLTPLETFIRILPSILLFTILIWCCCKGEAPNSTRAFESPGDRRARREAMESQLIIKNVIRASTPRRRPPSRFTSSDRAYSSFVLAIRMPNSNGQDVKFSEDDESLIIQAEEGKLHHVVATDRDDSPHAAASAACVHFSDSTIHNQAGKQQEQQEEQEQNVNDDDKDADAAGRQALASDAEHQERDSSLRSDSNRTNVSWIPSEEEESSCSSEHHYQQQQQQQLQLREQPLALPPPTATTTATTATTAPTLRLVRRRRKSNILARTISMSLRSSISSLQQQQQPTTCDICLMDYQVGEQVCWSPNDECVHCFHKDCMLDWLLRNPKCPVCRRNYLVKRDDSHEQQPQPPQEEETSQNARNSSDREFES